MKLCCTNNGVLVVSGELVSLLVFLLQQWAGRQKCGGGWTGRSGSRPREHAAERSFAPRLVIHGRWHFTVNNDFFFSTVFSSHRNIHMPPSHIPRYTRSPYIYRVNTRSTEFITARKNLYIFIQRFLWHCNQLLQNLSVCTVLD